MIRSISTFEDQEAMGSRKACELKLLTKKIISIEDRRRSYKYVYYNPIGTQTYVSYLVVFVTSRSALSML